MTQLLLVFVSSPFRRSVHRILLGREVKLFVGTTVVRARKILYLIAVIAALASISLVVIDIVGMNKTAPRYVMIHFDDGFKSQYDHAYPILKQYGLKGTFWIVCDNASGANALYMRWAEVEKLVADGQDIQNHGMTHARLPTLTDKQIEAEVGGCKEMVVRHGSSGDAYAIPFNEGNDEWRIVTAISKIHSYGKGDGGNPQLVDCGGNCEILNDDGTYNKHNRYTMVQWSHDSYSSGRSEPEVLDGFIQAVSRGVADSDGILKIPIITYHRINAGGTSPSTSLFESEMKYLHDNGFKTIGMDDITYDSVAKKFKLN